MSAQEFDLATVGVDPPGHAALFVAQAMVAVGTFLIHGMGLVLHGFLHQQALQTQGGLPDVLFDVAQARFGMVLDLLETLA
jgi:hypothetical protein